MLSYRHSFHAGNFADVLKHIVVVEIFEHLSQKEKPYLYVDTHAGAGMYNLSAGFATKLNEHDNGISKLHSHEWPELSAYFDIIKACNYSNQGQFYPGSPAIAAHYLRPQDHAWLYELHPKDAELLKKNTQKNRRIRVNCEDGFKGLNAVLPALAKRGLVLIDPSYEMKDDYNTVFTAIQTAYQKFTTGTFALWYPVIDRRFITSLELKFKKSGIRNIQLFELGLAPDSEGRGMTSSGMIVINPPWTLQAKMQTLLPKLAKALEDGRGAHFKCKTIVAE